MQSFLLFKDSGLDFEVIKEKGLKLGWFLSDIGEYERSEQLLHSLLSQINDIFGGKSSKQSTEIYYALVSIIRIHRIFPNLIL